MERNGRKEEMEKHEQFERALAAIQSRRTAAVAENQRRNAELAAKIPGIGELNRVLADTGKQLLSALQTGDRVQERIADIRKRNEEGQRIIRGLLVENGYPADYLDLHYTCSACDDTGYLRTGYCDCFKRELNRIAAESLNRQAQLTLSRFSDFSLDYYRAGGEQCFATMENVLRFCKDYAAGFSLSSPSLLMLGKTGLGKTHLSLAIAAEVIDAGYQVVYDSVINLLHKIEREHFGRAADENTLGLLLSCDFLIMDDLGAEFDSGFYVSTVYNVINTRLNRGLPTIISTNLRHEEVQKKYEERIVSRLFACYTCLQFQGKDIRLMRQRMLQEQRQGE